MNFIQELLQSQTLFCQHKDGCLLSAIKQALKNLKYGLAISLVLQLVKTLKDIVKNPKSLKQSFKIQYFSIALYLVSTILVMKIVRCFLRRIRQHDDGLNSLLAGAAGGWVASKTLSKEYWYFYLTFIASRIIGAFHKRLIQKGVLSKKNEQWHSYAMMAFAHGVHSYGYFLNPYILKNDMYGLYEKMSALTPNQKRWHLSALKFVNRRTKQIYGTYPQFDNITQQRINRLEGIVQKQELHKH